MRRIIENSTIVFCRKNKEKKRNKIFSNVFIFNQNDKIWATYFFHFEFIPEYCDLLETQTRRRASNGLTFRIL